MPLPAEVLRDSGVHPGDQLDISAEDGDIILRKIAHVASESLLDILRGLKGLPIPERTRSPVRAHNTADFVHAGVRLYDPFV